MTDGGDVMDNLLTGFHLLEFVAVTVVGLFWLQIFIRGALQRTFKFEYISCQHDRHQYQDDRWQQHNDPR